jgi:hypothetical protein
LGHRDCFRQQSVAALIELKREGYEPRRELVLGLSGDEETTMKTTEILAKELSDAKMVLNVDGTANPLMIHVRPWIGRVSGDASAFRCTSRAADVAFLRVDVEDELRRAGRSCSRVTATTRRHRDRCNGQQQSPLAGTPARESRAPLPWAGIPKFAEKKR